MKMDDMVKRNITKKTENKKKQKTFSIALVVIISIVVGIGTYILCSSLLPKKEPEIIQDEVLSLTDENVEILYNYVSYGKEYNKMNKFVSNKNVTIDSFNNEEKLFYALQFAGPQDFEFTGEMDKDKNKVYIITTQTIKKYLERFFGSNITVSNIASFTHTFDFEINKMNVGTMKYNSERNGYDTVFSKKEEIKEVEVKSYYSELENAVRKPDGKIVLKEKVVYTKVIEEENTNKVEIYKDPNQGILIETKNINKKEILNINMSNMENTGFIEYTFALDDNNIYYFESSEYKTE